MEQDLRNKFEELKFCTLECINSLQNNDYDTLDKLILKRQVILDSISKMNGSNEEYSNIVNDLDIFSKQKMLSDIIIKKRIELRGKIDSIEKNKTATNSYNKGQLKSAVIFSKKI